jgi:cytidylate kinase
MSGKIESTVPATAKLIEQQLGKWELALKGRGQESVPGGEPVENFICISRMVGIDGHDIGILVGERLGWPVFGREILEAMAEDDAIRRRIYSRMDERDLTWWEESLRAVLDSDFVRNDYFKRLCETVLSLARQSRSVFVGRGADLILPTGQGLRVRLVAGLASRVRWYAAAAEIDPDKARRDVERVEKERAEFLHHRFGADASDPLRHDLVLNLDRWNTEDVVGMILDAYRRKTTASRSG